MKRPLPVLIALFGVSGLITACNALGQGQAPTQTARIIVVTATPVSGGVQTSLVPGGVQVTAPPAGAEQATLTPGTDPANGEQIYFTGTDKNGNRIDYTGGPNFGGMMMGGFLTCASCHGPQAGGGKHFMHMQVMDAPPIFYSALAQMKVEDTGGTQTPEGYTLANFGQEVEGGKDVDGNPLDANMPRWQMSDKDLADLFAFLKTIQQ